MRKKLLAVWVLSVVIVALAIWGFLEGRKELALEQEREQPVEAPSRVEPRPDHTVVIFDEATQKRADLLVMVVPQTTRQEEIEALATVLSFQPLIDLRNNYVGARAQLDKASAMLEASRREYDRLKTLHNGERNISDKALQAAEAVWRGDVATVWAAQAAVDAMEQIARQAWGGVLASAIANHAPLFQHLSAQREVLLRIAVTSATDLSKPPATVQVDADNGKFLTAALISASPQADPHIQGATFFYTAPAETLRVGTTLTARLPIASQETGAVIPESALVWWQGKAWGYIQHAPDQFVRRELADAIPVAEGWFVPGFEAAQGIVVRGASVLLSEELRAQIQVGEEG